MAGKTFKFWTTDTGDQPFGPAQAGAVGQSFGNGAAAFVPGAASGSLIMGGAGNINVQQSTAGISPGSTGSDIVLCAYTLPANAFDLLSRGLNLFAAGSTAANTNTKTLKLIWNATTAVVGSAVTGGTTIASLTLNSVAGGGGWQMEANVYKNNAANSQTAIHAASQGGNVVGSLTSPTTNLAAVESGPIIIAVTGNSATTAGDIVFNFFEAFAMN